MVVATYNAQGRQPLRFLGSENDNNTFFNEMSPVQNVTSTIGDKVFKCLVIEEQGHILIS
jgi:hypothetical protein